MIKKPDSLRLTYYELILTENCNLRCKYCFDDYLGERDGAHATKTKTKMSADIIPQLGKFIYDTFDRKSPKIDISFFGGEPTLNWGFIEKFVHYAKNNLKLPYNFTMNTNCTMLDSEKIDFIVENNIGISASIDGTQASHDVNRIKADGKSSWEDTIRYLPELIAKASSKRQSINAIMVVDNNNYRTMTESYEFLHSLGLDLNPLFNTDVEQPDEYFKSLEEQIYDIVVKKRLPIPAMFSRKIKNLDYQRDGRGWCFQAERNVTIAPDGKLFFCHQLMPKMHENPEHGEEFYGDIYSGYMNLEYYEMIRNRVDINKFAALSEECRDCKVVNWCKGGCLATHYHQNKKYNEINKNLCKLNLTLQSIWDKINMKTTSK